MAVKIRLKRMGKIRQPHYRIVVIDGRAKRDGRPIEEIGTYNPMTNPSTIKVESERAQYWLGVGAQPSDRVLSILKPVSYTHLTLPTILRSCRYRWSPYH